MKTSNGKWENSNKKVVYRQMDASEEADFDDKAVKLHLWAKYFDFTQSIN